jgi:DNA (cytosine-5)-methyltransferase 1
MRNGIAYSEDLLANPVDNYLTLEDILEKNVDEKYYLDSNLSDWEYLKGSKRIERTHRDGHKYVFAEGKVAFPDHIDRPARAILRSEASKNRSTHIIRDPENGKLRKLTPVECERLNGFPDDWTNTGMSEQFRYFCMGNAVVVDIVKIIGQRLDAIISDES